MSKLETFGLCTGIIGLISDTIALITFFAGHWGAPSTTAIAVPATAVAQGTVFTITTNEIPLVARTILILMLIYSWAAISWVLARRSFQGRKVKNIAVVQSILFRSVAGFGILTLPILTMWTITLWQADLPSRAEAQKVYSEYQAKTVSDTRTCRDGTLRSGGFLGDDCVWDKTDAGSWAVPISFIFQAGLIGILYLVFYLLTPVIYPDMAAAEMDYEAGILIPALANKGDEVSEAIGKVFPIRRNAKS